MEGKQIVMISDIQVLDKTSVKVVHFLDFMTIVWKPGSLHREIVLDILHINSVFPVHIVPILQTSVNDARVLT